MKNKVKTAVIGAITGFINGLFGAGGGTLLVPGMERFLKVEAHKAHATAIAVILPLSAVSAFVYVQKGLPNLTALFSVSAGGIIGGVVGAKWLSKIPKQKLWKLFGLFMIAAAVRMII